MIPPGRDRRQWTGYRSPTVVVATKSGTAALGCVFKAESPSRGRLGYNVPKKQAQPSGLRALPISCVAVLFLQREHDHVYVHNLPAGDFQGAEGQLAATGFQCDATQMKRLELFDV